MNGKRSLMFGNTGKIININLSTRSIAIETLPEAWYRLYIGGSGLAAKIFQERGRFSLDPLDPEAMLIFMNGPFAGLKLSGASRGGVAGCSPLTGHWGDSSCGGYFAPELRYCGFDGLIVTGKAAEPSLISIEGEQVALLPAAQYWGLGTEAATKSLREGFGKDIRTMMIGPAGENGVKFANIIHDGQNAAGRAGFGALM